MEEKQPQNSEETLFARDLEHSAKYATFRDSYIFQLALIEMEEEISRKAGQLEALLLENMEIDSEHMFDPNLYEALTPSEQQLVKNYQQLKQGTKTTPGITEEKLREVLLQNRKQEQQDWQESFESFSSLVKTSSTAANSAPQHKNVSIGINFNTDNIPTHLELLNDKGGIIRSFELVESNGEMKYKFTYDPIAEDPWMAAYGKRNDIKYMYQKQTQLMDFDEALKHIHGDFNYHAFKNPNCVTVYQNQEVANSNKVEILSEIESVIPESTLPSAYLKGVIQKRLADDKITEQELKEINDIFDMGGYDISLSRNKRDKRDKTLETLNVSGDERFSNAIREFLDENSTIETNTYTAPVPKPNGTPTIER